VPGHVPPLAGGIPTDNAHTAATNAVTANKHAFRTGLVFIGLPLNWWTNAQ
jgi:hypothetical protein